MNDHCAPVAGRAAERDEWGRTGLHYAAADVDLAALERWLAVENVNVADNNGWTPLHFGAQAAAQQICERLLDAGADVHALTARGMPPIYHAAMAHCRDPIATIRILRARGADPTRSTIRTYFGTCSPLEVIREVRNRPEIQSEFTDLLGQGQP